MTPATARPLRYIHRRVDGTEVYFVANPNAQPVQARCAFRVTGKRPEFWHPDTGQIESCERWQPEATRTVMQLSLDPVGSIFVAFAEPSSRDDPVVAVAHNGAPVATTEIWRGQDGRLWLQATAGGSYALKTASGKNFRADVPDPPLPMIVTGKWELTFPTNWGAPEHLTLDSLISWTDHTDPGVKYFSGTATYRTTMHVPNQWIADDVHVFLDLGRVAVIAEPRLNGQPLGILWKPPFVSDITGVVKPGDNSLEVNVVNLWPNRLIGDQQLPEDCQWSDAGADGRKLARWPHWILEGKPSPTGRHAFATWQHWAKDSPLLESGLLGPVTLRTARTVRVD
jgi:hypothetical protein